MKRKERNHTADKFFISNPFEGALISFSVMETVLALFSQPGAFVSFGGPKERRGYCCRIGEKKNFR